MTAKAIGKRTAKIAALVLVAPAALLYYAASGITSPERAFPGWSQLFALFPGVSGVYLRRAFYQLVLPECGEGACISFGTTFSHSTACVGRNVYVGAYCCLGAVNLEDDVLIGSHVSIMNGSRQHGIARLDIPVREQPGEWPRVTIGQDTWIGDRAVVMADLGRHAVVGAGSVVTRAVGDFEIVVGNPARVIARRDDAPRKCPAPAAVAAINGAT